MIAAVVAGRSDPFPIFDIVAVHIVWPALVDQERANSNGQNGCQKSGLVADFN